MADINKTEVAAYIKSTQDVLKKFAAFEAGIPRLVDDLIRSGQIEAHMKSATIRRFTDEPSQICDVIGKIAVVTKTAALGDADDTSDDIQAVDADERFARRVMSRT